MKATLEKEQTTSQSIQMRLEDLSGTAQNTSKPEVKTVSDISQKELKIRNAFGMKTEHIKEVVITPEMARLILLSFNNNNRKLGNKTIQQYASDMKNDKWDKSNDTITFDDNWELSNGQHRFNAIIMANKPVTMIVQFHVNQSCEMDRGKQRTISENISITDKVDNLELRENRRVHEVLNTALKCIRHAKYIRADDLADLINKHEKLLLDLLEAGMFTGAHGYGQAAIAAAFFAASINGVPLETLKHIRMVINNGLMTKDQDIPIIGLRDKLKSISGNGSSISAERIKYTMYCIKAVKQGKTTKICRSMDIYYKI